MTSTITPRRRSWTLTLFTLAYALNFVDRQIVVILAPSLKEAFGVGDAALGLLYGTAFALFYGLFGLILARLADTLNRVAVLAAALFAWSLLTGASALVTGFAGLALLRAGVGIGEAGAAPAAFSILQDLFPRERRATALSIHASGIYLGIGASLLIGGLLLKHWEAGGPWGLADWQATYLAVGAPGLVLAALIALTVREPVRGASDATPAERPRGSLGGIGTELALLVPGLASVALARLGVDRRTVTRHLLLLAGCAVATPLAIAAARAVTPAAKLTPFATPFGWPIDATAVQWIAVAVGIHAAAGWIAAFRRRDPAAAAATIGSGRFRLLALGGGVVSIASYGIAGFLFLYGKSYVGLVSADGAILGLLTAAAGLIGTTTSGLLADRAQRSHPAGRIRVAAAAVALSTVFTAGELLVSARLPFFCLNFLATLTLTMWLGPIFAAAQDGVPAASRGAATALQFLAINLVGLGFGPYLTGLISDASGSLRAAMLVVLVAAPAALILWLRAAALTRPGSAPTGAARP